MQSTKKDSNEVDLHLPGDRQVDDDDDDDHSAQANFAGWRDLFNFTSRGHVPVLTLAIALSIGSGIVIPAMAIFIGKIFGCFTAFGSEKISGPDLRNKVSTYALALLVLGCVSGLLNALYFATWMVFGELQAKSARERLFVGILDKDMKWFDKRNAGTDTRLQSFVRELQTGTSQPLGLIVQYTVTGVVAIGVAFYFSWSLTLVTLAIIPVSAIVCARIAAQIQHNVEAQAEELAKASKIAHTAISAIDIVKSFNGQDAENWQYAEAIRKAARCYLAQAQANALQIGFIRFVTLAIFVVGFWFGSHLVNTGSGNSGDILTCFWACLIAMQSADQLSPQLLYLEKGRAAGASLTANFMRIESGRKIKDMIGKVSPENCTGDIQVHNITFSYPSRPNQLALNRATFHFRAGETTFVIGESGSGKSTLGDLLLGFYSPCSGDILLDGCPLRTLDTEWIRSNITLVQQQSILFNGTIFNNIAYGHKNHSRVRKDQVQTAIATASLQQTIKSLPKGLDTIVGTRGNAMSGGQQQRIAIARARLRDTPILILDEATSALDHKSKILTMDAIRSWRQGKTTIIITHDTSQVGENDFVYVLKDGEITQQGIRRELKQLEQKHLRNRKPMTEPPNIKQQQNPLLRKQNSSSPHPQIGPLQNDTIPVLAEVWPKRNLTLFGAAVDNMESRSVSRRRFSILSPVAFPTQRWGRSQTSTLLNPKSSDLMPSKFQKSVEPTWVRNYEHLGATEMKPVPCDLMTAVLHQEDAYKKARANNSLRNPTLANIVTKLPWHKRKSKQLEESHQTIPLKKILMSIWPLLIWNDCIILIMGIFCAGTSAAATPVFAFVFAKLLGVFFLVDHSQRIQQARTWSLCVLAVAFADAIASYFMHYLLERCSQVWTDTLRKKALNRILDQPKSWFDEDDNNLTHLTECLDRNAEETRNLLGRLAAPIFVAVITTCMAVLWSMVLSWKLTLVGLTCVPYMYILISSFETVSSRWEGWTNEAAAITNGIFTETFSNIRTVRALTLEPYFRKKYFDSVHNALRIGLRRSAYSSIFFGLRDSSIPCVTALIFYYGAVLASSHAYTVQTIFTVITMLLFSLTSATESMATIPQISSSRNTASQLLRLTRLPYKASHEYSGRIHLADPSPITFKNVTFTYPSRPTHPVLRRLNLSLSPATSTALVGASGSGKSTLASLLLALYPPDHGTITINRVSIAKLHTRSLRSLIALVPQHPTLFPTTIANNITYALPHPCPPATRAAAKAAHIAPFIDSLPLAYDTPVGPGADRLSGGQAQRIAIARALVRTPRLLILDEATSALDHEAAGCVRDMLRGLEDRGVAILAVTHDRRMMRMCREVVVLRDGGVCERGRYRDLMLRGGELARLMGREKGGGGN